MTQDLAFILASPVLTCLGKQEYALNLNSRTKTHRGTNTKVMFGIHLPPEGITFNRMREVCLAAVTEKIKLGPLVSCVWYRPPTVLGKIATTVDLISNGRVIVGVGAGWHEGEFKAYFGRFPTVGERENALEEAAQILRGMLRKKETTFRGENYRVENLVNLPSPSRGSIPIMVGGGGEKRTLRVAAKYGDISHFFANSTQEVERKIGILNDHCRRNGRDPSEISLATGLTPTIEGVRFSAQPVEYIEACVKLGVSIFTLMFSRLGDAASEAQRRFAEEIIPSFKT